MGRARLRTGGRFTGGEPAVTHVAFAHDAEALGKFWDIVGTLQDAVAAADALVVEVAYDPGERIFFVGEDRTAVQAPGVGAVVTRGRDRLRERPRAARTDEQADVSPRFGFVEAVERVTRGNARLAPRAGVEIDLERVLLARSRRAERNQRGLRWRGDE
jgi:hypothetical protein